MHRPDASGRLRIVVLGYIIRGPLGGFAWHHLQYVTGFAKLGHEVVFVEESGDFPGCYDPSTGITGTDPGYGLRFAAKAFRSVGLDDRWAYFDAHSSRWFGPRADSILGDCDQADLLVNLCDAELLSPWLEEIPTRALVDTDPAFSQIRHLEDPTARIAVDQHTVFFSFGENIESGASTVPDDGVQWQATRQPVDLDAWVGARGNPRGRWTTVMQWDSYRAAERGVRYGMKSESFAPYLDFPARTESKLEIALGSPTAPRELLERKGWRLRNPLPISQTLDTYRDYLFTSKGEFALAKHGYVVSRSGWFSERSACYLASGRPTVVQDTGFTDLLPTGEGLLAFTSPEEAVICLDQAERRYDSHCAAARELAREFFDGQRVLSSLVERALHPRLAESSPR